MEEITKRVRKLRKAQTSAEKLFWEEVRNNKLGTKIVRQHPIKYYDGKNKRIFIADFCCKLKKIVIELDGGVHENQKEYDQARTYIINILGYKVIRFTNEEIFNHLDYVLKKIRSYL